MFILNLIIIKYILFYTVSHAWKPCHSQNTWTLHLNVEIVKSRKDRTIMLFYKKRTVLNNKDG